MPAFSQNRIIYGFVKDAATGKPIPFPKIVLEEGKLEQLGDMEGNFTLILPATCTSVTFKAYMYLESEQPITSDDSLKVYLNFAHPFSYQSITSPSARQLIRKLVKNRADIDPQREKGFEYQSYNKTVITTQYISALKLYIQGLLTFFGQNRMTFGTDHHIFLMESSSIRKFKNRFNQREKVVYSKISGISKPPALSLASGFEPLSIFSPFMRIGPKKYISPLGGRPWKRYHYFIQDSLKTSDNTIYIVRFNPKSTTNRELLQGLFYVAKRPFGVMAFQAWPAFDRESTFSLLQQAEPSPQGRWFPSQIKTSYQRNSMGNLKIPIEASSKTYLFNFSNAHFPDTSSFDEVIFDFENDSLFNQQEFPARLRQERLTQKDKNTYAFYQQIGPLPAIDRYLNFGQKVANGRIPFGRIDLVFRRAITVNDLEGLRLGLGFQTTSKWSKKNQFGAYLAYGIRDDRWKYGFNYGYYFTPKLSIQTTFQKDLQEPGIQPMAFYKPQYNTEQLRTIRISRFDHLRIGEAALQAELGANLLTKAGLAIGHRTPLYAYSFSEQPEWRTIGVSEARFALHWFPGEQFLKIGGDKISLGSDFPGFWLQYSQGLTGLVRNTVAYSKLEAKTQWTKRILGLGEIGIQVVGGIMSPQAPYPMLFTARGSYRDFSLISFNSYETMRYNEFINDRYISVFYSHKFSKIQISTLPYRPYFTMVHNAGWGSLRLPQNHLLIEAKGMPKGFFESGLFLNDLFIIPLFGMDLGVGGGFFVRYGPYAFPDPFENLAIKFSANLSL